MKNYSLPILQRISSEGQGNMSYAANNAPGGNFTGANNGVSLSTITPGSVVLGQNVLQAGNPANLLSIREIPLNGFSLLMSGITPANPALILKQNAANSNSPQIIFQDSGGVERGRIMMAGSFGQYLLIGQQCAPNAVTTTAGNGIIALGDFCGNHITTGETLILMGSGALQGSAIPGPSNWIAIGNDCVDRNGAFINDSGICIGNNSLSGGAGKTIGLRALIIGSATSGPGANSQIIGDDVIIIGHLSNPIDNITNTTIIGNLQNGVTFYNLSNTILLGTNTQNTLIGQTVGAWTNNGNRLQISGKLNTGGAAPLTIGAGAIDFGKVVTAASALNATKYWEVSVDGVLLKVCIN